MAAVAAFVCSVFIAWLLVRDSKHRTALSAATWIPTIMLFTFGSRTPAVWLDLAGFDLGIDVNEIFYVLIIGASLFVLFSRAVKWGNLFAANTALTLFYGYFAISSLWSASPADSFIRIVRDFATNILVALVILTDKKPLEALRAVYVRCACVAFPLSALYSRFYSIGKTYSRDGGLSFNGVGEQKNSFGAMVMVFCLFLMWDHLESQPASAKWPWSRIRWEPLVLLLMGIWLLLLSQSKTSLVCLLIGLTLISTKGWAASRMISIGSFCAALSLPFLILLTQGVGLITPILEALGRDATFTGRASLWQQITLSTVNPVIGSGFWTFWGTATGKAIAQMLDPGTPGKTVPSAHDGYLDIYLDGGFIGLAVVFILFVVCGKQALKAFPLNGFSRLRFVVMVVAIFANLTESSLARPCALWFSTALLFINYRFNNADVKGREQVGRARDIPRWRYSESAFWH